MILHTTDCPANRGGICQKAPQKLRGPVVRACRCLNSREAVRKALADVVQKAAVQGAGPE